MPNIRIGKVVAGDRGRYVARMDGVAGAAEISFTRRGPKLISADHTDAPETMRGTGAALALVEFMVADARAQSFKVIPVCSYVQAQYRKHPEWLGAMAPLD